jgi:hypothetical protein
MTNYQYAIYEIDAFAESAYDGLLGCDGCTDFLTKIGAISGHTKAAIAALACVCGYPPKLLQTHRLYYCSMSGNSSATLLSRQGHAV